MDPVKSLDYYKVIAALLCDVQMLHSNVITSSTLAKTLERVEHRVATEGIGFLTKTLPRLGKALDKALSEIEPLDAEKLALTCLPDSKLPLFLGELFQQVLSKDGVVLPCADVISVKTLRQVCYLFYKLELPYDSKDEQDVIESFERTEDEIQKTSEDLSKVAEVFASPNSIELIPTIKPVWAQNAIREARLTLNRVFQTFDPLDIYPRHGPGAVSTREQLQGKYTWTSIPKRITDLYPIDAYFYASLGHVCDEFSDLQKVRDDQELLARVCLVPKDSRGPRLISCEPLAFQWIQQGLSQAIVKHVERHHLTRWSVRFTNQQPNQFAAVQGSKHGRYATLDLKEASDRVSVGLVQLLFPDTVLPYLLGCRSLGTKLPNGRELILHKFAPMGSALCFPVLALSVWSLLVSGLRALGAHIENEDVFVYGDDVIVPTELAEHAMIILKSFGLKVNRDKSCTKGFFRESCGMDAYKGISVTPVRIRTVWSKSPCPDAFVSWISYANSFHERGYYKLYDLIVSWLTALYGAIPGKACGKSAPSLVDVSLGCRCTRTRTNHDLQKRECLIWDVTPRKVTREINGWKMLLRFFSEANSKYELQRHPKNDGNNPFAGAFNEPFRVREYTFRKRNKMRRCWR